MLLRRQNDDLQRVWAFLGQSRLAQKLQNPRTLRTSGNKVRGAFRSRRLWRMWPLSSGQFAFFRAEFGLLRFPDERGLVEWKMPRSEFKTALDALEASGQQLETLFERLGADEQSDFHNARNWRAAQHENWNGLEFRRGTRQEFEEVLRCVAHLFLDPQKLDYWLWIPSFHAHFDSLNLKELSPMELMAWNPACRSAVQRIAALLEEEFDIGVESSPWRAYNNRGERRTRLWPHLKFAEPTMHERLEAQLSLRDWMRGKIPEAEIEALLKSVVA